MARELGSTATGTTGNHVISFNTVVNPDLMEFFIGGKSADTVNHTSIGWYDNNQSIQACISTFTDGTGSASKSSSSKCVSHWERVGGVLTEVIAGTVTACGGGDFTLNLTAANSNYSIFFTAHE